MRGIPGSPRDDAAELGITPAHAGNTARLPCEFLETGDHPRACGEYVFFYFKSWTNKGSPPRMRGIRGLEFLIQLCDGITPAHAGNT